MDKYQSNLKDLCRCGQLAIYDSSEEGGPLYCAKCYYEEVQVHLVKIGVARALDELVQQLNSSVNDSCCRDEGCPVCAPRYRSYSPKWLVERIASRLKG